MLELTPDRPPSAPRPAATVLLLRDGDGGVEVCVMQRSPNSAFMGGAIVFPGGRIEATDAPDRFAGHLVLPTEGPWLDDDGLAARIAACREAVEEVSLVPIVGAGDPAVLRKDLHAGLAATGARLDLAALVPLSRWVTPEAEPRRYDARFFVARAPSGQTPRSDDHEAVRVLFAAPAALLADGEAGRISLFPPTHRTLELLARAATVDEVLEAARLAPALEPICPRFVLDGGVPTLALPGDPLHEISTPRIAGRSRYVLRDTRWVAEDAPT